MHQNIYHFYLLVCPYYLAYSVDAVLLFSIVPGGTMWCVHIDKPFQVHPNANYGSKIYDGCAMCISNLQPQPLKSVYLITNNVCILYYSIYQCNSLKYCSIGWLVKSKHTSCNTIALKINYT